MDVTLSTNPRGTPEWIPPADLRSTHVHLVGIGGSGMAGLARLLLQHGAGVSGTDRCASPATEELRRAGADVRYEQHPPAIPAASDVLVASAAIPHQHAELEAARSRDLPILKYARMLGVLLDRYEGIAVAGTHGKSTTTAWLAYTLRLAGLDPNYIVGANCDQLGSGSATGSGRHFVVESCEFDRSFLNLRPASAVILNIDEDHLDCYRDVAEIEAAFASFAGQVRSDGYLLCSGDCERARRVAAAARTRVETYGLRDDCDWRATNVAVVDGRPEADISYRGQLFGRVHLELSGRHNLSNGLAVAALAYEAGADWPSIARGLGTFRGAQRRLEDVARVNEVQVVDDYAHHPVEIQATLAAARERFAPQRLICVFQPHQHSRTRFLLEDFATSFSGADQVLMSRIYFVRDSAGEREAIHASDLVERIAAQGGDAEFLPEFPDLVDRLAGQVRSGDLVITMGAGDIGKVAHDLAARLRGNLPG